MNSPHYRRILATVEAYRASAMSRDMFQAWVRAELHLCRLRVREGFFHGRERSLGPRELEVGLAGLGLVGSGLELLESDDLDEGLGQIRAGFERIRVAMLLGRHWPGGDDPPAAAALRG